MKDINLLSLDLEMNSTGSIIQVGACVGNLASGNILEEYCSYIRVNEVLDPRIIKLTGIKQFQVDTGIYLIKAYNDLIDLYKRNDCQNRGCTLTWGGGDTEILRQELNLPKFTTIAQDSEAFFFGRRWLDVKTLFISYQFAKDCKHQSGLAKSLLRMNLQFKGKKHNATSDAINTFLIYRELLKKFNV